MPYFHVHYLSYTCFSLAFKTVVISLSPTPLLLQNLLKETFNSDSHRSVRNRPSATRESGCLSSTVNSSSEMSQLGGITSLLDIKKHRFTMQMPPKQARQMAKPSAFHKFPPVGGNRPAQMCQCSYPCGRQPYHLV